MNAIKQFSHLNVNETGSEVVTTTMNVFLGTVVTPSASFICDHPFGIIISDNNANTILFMGRVMNPDSR